MVVERFMVAETKCSLASLHDALELNVICDAKSYTSHHAHMHARGASSLCALTDTACIARMSYGPGATEPVYRHRTLVTYTHGAMRMCMTFLSCSFVPTRVYPRVSVFVLSRQPACTVRPRKRARKTTPLATPMFQHGSRC